MMGIRIAILIEASFLKPIIDILPQMVPQVPAGRVSLATARGAYAEDRGVIQKEVVSIKRTFAVVSQETAASGLPHRR